jgi:hypothetical protein
MTVPAVNTAGWIIKSAMRSAGLIGRTQEPTSEDYADHLVTLNELVNLWQTQGLKLCLIQDITVTLTAGQALYTFGPAGTTVMDKPLRVTDAYYSDSNGIRRPLSPLARSDYVRLSQVNQSGPINQYFVDKQTSLLKVSFWLVPDAQAATGTAHLVMQTQAAGMVSLTSTMAFPQEWAIALRWGLADEICTGQPQVIMDRCASRAASYRRALEDWDIEDAPVSFAPNLPQGWGSPSSFR